LIRKLHAQKEKIERLEHDNDNLRTVLSKERAEKKRTVEFVDLCPRAPYKKPLSDEEKQARRAQMRAQPVALNLSEAADNIEVSTDDDPGFVMARYNFVRENPQRPELRDPLRFQRGLTGPVQFQHPSFQEEVIGAELLKRELQIQWLIEQAIIKGEMKK